jgi:hypothetical protein
MAEPPKANKTNPTTRNFNIPLSCCAQTEVNWTAAMTQLTVPSIIAVDDFFGGCCRNNTEIKGIAL